MNTILVPTDLQPTDRAAFRYALDLAMHYNWSLRLVHAWPTAYNAGDVPIFIPKEDKEKALDTFFNGIKLMRSEVDFLEKIGFEKTVLEGSPTPALLEYAERVKATLIVAASPRHNGLDRLLFGSVSGDLARLADCPVLLVPEHAVFQRFETIVFATDRESLKPVFLNRAIDLANEFHGFLQFIHVGDDILQDETVHERLRKELVRDRNPQFGWAWEYVEADSVERGLREWLLETPANLVILSTHHRGFFETVGHHSVSAGMAKNPLFPTLIFHEEDATDGTRFDSIKDLRKLEIA